MSNVNPATGVFNKSGLPVALAAGTPGSVGHVNHAFA